MDPVDRINQAIARCRAKYNLSLVFEARKKKALYEALAEAYGLVLMLRADARLRAAFYHVLRSEGIKDSDDKILLLIKYAFVPHVFLPQKKADEVDRKADLNKASEYAIAISYALAHKVKSAADLLKFIEDNGGIQAIAHAESKRSPRHVTRRRSKLAKPVPAAAAVLASAAITPPRPGLHRFPLELWYSDDTVLKAISRAYGTKSTQCIIRVRLEGTSDGIVTAVATPSPLRPFPNPPIRPGKRQPAGKAGPTRPPVFAPAKTGMSPPKPASKSMPSRPLGKRSARLGKAPWHQ